MAWLAAQINIDEEEDFEKTLVFTEYLGSFTNLEMVKHAQEQRANRKTTSDEEFDELLTNISGRPAPRFRKDRK